ncbi:CrcB family protein [Williamsia sp. CHRR-6]|nr:CrcB family protein [Williamsia sp. CHRR-6]
MIGVWVALAGSLGAVARFVVDGELVHRFRWTTPWQVLLVNVTGSMLIGLIAGIVAAGHADRTWLSLVGTGFCGGYTTFSTVSVETVTLLRTGRTGAAVAFGGANLLLSLLACAIGLGAGHLLG